MTRDLSEGDPATPDYDPSTMITSAQSPAPYSQPIPEAERQRAISAYWSERQNYLAGVRKVPELRKKFVQALAIYTLRRALWSFGFFPVFIAFWVPLVMSSFNPVVLINEVLPALQGFVGANPEVQANTISTLLTAWLSVGFFFLVFDFVLTPFKSPYQYEADVHMRAWEQSNHDQLPDKV
ncbi:hypothetical protein [Marinobacter caseinilyticus]|uniref:hypothetical protein n=1 Tax=Marinobacter caseinilyticus TaxID=2692195 RepID=UPI001F30E8D3|nr:hypothetical protein [Marinobacter caseinilyticus]